MKISVVILCIMVAKVQCLDLVLPPPPPPPPPLSPPTTPPAVPPSTPISGLSPSTTPTLTAPDNVLNSLLQLKKSQEKLKELYTSGPLPYSLSSGYYTPAFINLYMFPYNIAHHGWLNYAYNIWYSHGYLYYLLYYLEYTLNLSAYGESRYTINPEVITLLASACLTQTVDFLYSLAKTVYTNIPDDTFAAATSKNPPKNDAKAVGWVKFLRLCLNTAKNFNSPASMELNMPKHAHIGHLFDNYIGSLYGTFDSTSSNDDTSAIKTIINTVVTTGKAPLHKWHVIHELMFAVSEAGMRALESYV